MQVKQTNIQALKSDISSKRKCDRP